jgi:hypothetical protein
MSKIFKALARVLLGAVLLNSPVYSGSYSQENVTPEQFTQDFDYLWSQLKDKYAYFDKKETDWNVVREVYRPRVAKVGIKESSLPYWRESWKSFTILIRISRSTRIVRPA